MIDFFNDIFIKNLKILNFFYKERFKIIIIFYLAMFLTTVKEKLNLVPINKPILIQIRSGNELTSLVEQIIGNFEKNFGDRKNDAITTALSVCFDSMKTHFEKNSEELDKYLSTIKRQSNKVIEQYQNLIDQHISNITEFIYDIIQDRFIDEENLEHINNNFMELLNEHSENLTTIYNLISDAGVDIRTDEYKEFENKFIEEIGKILTNNENKFRLPKIRKQIECDLQFAESVSVYGECEKI